MKLFINKVSDRNFSEEVEINSIEDLAALSEQYGEDIIFRMPRGRNDRYTLLVYDDYIE